MSRLVSGRAALALVALAGCTQKVIIQREVVYVDRPVPGEQIPGKRKDLPPPPPPREAQSDDTFTTLPPAPVGLDSVLENARAHVGKNAVRVNGVSFRYDCSGYVRGMYSAAGLDLMALGNDYPGANGVTLIFNFVQKFGENHTRKIPAVGEIVYFDNTWDKNNNGRLDDPLTHVGLVDEVQPDGTFWVLHRANRGIVRDPMNVLRGNDRTDDAGTVINGYLRPKTRRDAPGTGYLMGSMFAGFGTVRAPRDEARRLLFPDWPGAAEAQPADPDADALAAR